MIYFTSDSHYGHRNILGFSRGSFRSIEEHDETLIREWNALVGPNDTVYHLGDFALCNKSRMSECWHALQGRKQHVPGNHDQQSFLDMIHTWADRGLGHALLGRLHTFRSDGERAELCHYPLEVWDRGHHGAFHLHGHSHDNCNTRPNAKRLDVGVDTAKRLLGTYRPFSWDEVRDIMSKRTGDGARDHHEAPLPTHNPYGS